MTDLEMEVRRLIRVGSCHCWDACRVASVTRSWSVMPNLLAGAWWRLSLVLPLALGHAASHMHRGRAGCVFLAVVAGGIRYAPIADADVTVPDLARSAKTNWIGEGVISGVPRGRHHVRVRKLGYAGAELDVLLDRDTVGVFFVLQRQPQSLDTVRTKTTALPSLMMGDYEMRRRMGIGRFITDSMLRADSTQPLASILENRIVGLQSVNDGRTVHRRNCVVNGQLAVSGQLDVYIDGTRVSTSRYALGRPPDETDLRALYGSDIAGVEYYTDVDAPVQF